MDFAELSHEQRRQLIDAQQTFSVWRAGTLELRKLGTMRVQSSKKRRYMYSVHGSVRRSLGPETPELIAQKAAHDERLNGLRRSIASTHKQLERMAPVNRALGLGRMPKIAARILRETRPRRPARLARNSSRHERAICL